jgi:hypothetical protein
VPSRHALRRSVQPFAHLPVQILPGSAIPSNRAAILTPSPIRSVALLDQIVPIDHRALHLDGAAHCIDHAAELDEAAVLDDAPVMRVDGGIDQVAPQSAQPRQRAILVSASETQLSRR